MKLLLVELKQQLKKHSLWQLNAPNIVALSSQQPFAVDTLEPQEWLQWIFIARMESLIEAGGDTPKGFEITPYFEEVWKRRPELAEVLMVLKQIDEAAK
ncbi:YqcC family protein [Vibrio wakamikoensis]|uniref:YqcC family protein n=1 Tax=Vibrio chaetopteri TaxID=3016528 RepID=A0AAU8BGB7_9VIBR